ncbi:MAG TPA: hypothetical protein VGV40_12605, partial [Solirubrobacteraceae bacterium]|nr:hypothetical protein [Solirubrobacteraceae bacterium]
MSTAHEGAVTRPRPGGGTWQPAPSENSRDRERRTIALLALPTLGFALSTTVVTTYLPVVASVFV